MLEVTEKILASIHAMPMSYGDVEQLMCLKNISEYGISFSIDMLIKKDFIIEKVVHKRYRYGSIVKTWYYCTKKGEKYLVEHGYLN